MSVMPGHLTKRPILKRLDELSKGDKQTFQNAYADLNALPWNLGPQDLITLGKKPAYAVFKTLNEENHLSNHWFGNWWLAQQPTVPVIRRGLLKAFRLAIDHSKPLDCYWCCAGESFEVVCCLSDQQVTVIFTTPPPPGQHPTDFPDEENIWIVKRTATGPGEIEESGANGIYTVQLKTDNNLP